MALNFSLKTKFETFLPFDTAQNEWTYRLQMIRKAKAYLYISTYYIDYKYYGEIFIKELIHAAERGVKILLLIDSFGQQLGNYAESEDDVQAIQKLLEKLGKKGVSIKYYEPEFFVAKTAGAGQHFKIQVSEQQTALVSSGNISHRSYEQWNEFSFLIKGEIVNYLIQSFLSVYEQKNKFQKQQLNTKTTIGNHSEVEYLFCDPNFSSKKIHPFFFKEPNCISEKIIKLVHQSKKEIQISSFYFKPNKKILKAILSAADRGVKVKIFHSHRNALPETDLAWIGAAIDYNRLLKKRISIFENLKGEHSKVILFDKKSALFGSYNLETQAHDRLAECMIFTINKKIVQELETFISNIEHNPLTIKIKDNYEKDLPLQLRVKKILLAPFKKWL